MYGIGEARANGLYQTTNLEKIEVGANLPLNIIIHLRKKNDGLNQVNFEMKCAYFK